MSEERRPASGDAPALGDLPLTSPPADAAAIGYRNELAAVRQFTAVQARQAGLPPRRVDDLVIAVNELASNTLARTAGPGRLAIWSTPREVICQIGDTGPSRTSWAQPGLACLKGPAPIWACGSSGRSAIWPRSTPARREPPSACTCCSTKRSGEPGNAPTARPADPADVLVTGSLMSRRLRGLRNQRRGVPGPGRRPWAWCRRSAAVRRQPEWPDLS